MELRNDCPEEDEKPALGYHSRDEALDASHPCHIPHGVLPRRAAAHHGPLGEGRETKPTVVIMDSGLHFMTKRPDLKAIPYEKSLIQLKPYFTRLAATVPVYYKLTDDLQAARHRTHKMSLNLTKLYNDIAVRELHGTGVTLWDSTIPLSAQYNDACAKKNRNTPPLFKWKCSDARHLGYIVVDQFANMVYNAVCNKYLDLDQDHCGLEERRVMDGV
ncbi:uncharacterized protein LOC119596298 [Penaeus monodon]|uniref:uncharacterized protein LOC119596298 n=1 Tax=Penaeus monodon TaxID=6687 RepID=UPI0018A740B5|nr:uncharacterized protein LOC119596298 [Penaeus monodon]